MVLKYFAVTWNSPVKINFILAIDLLRSGQVTEIDDGPTQKGWSQNHGNLGQGAIDAECGLLCWKIVAGIAEIEKKSTSGKDNN